ncbi:hypothetical protein DFH09DRAFT_1345007 [Mycena vulgaris]|nr:hypothetical protein DFH09DRAFT_1345007 [Mycena vulgaris]
MKSSIVFCALSFAIAAVEAGTRDSNAHRLARGLPPLPPRRRQSGKRTTPSSTPFTCASKKTFCCADFASTSSTVATPIISGLGVPLSSCGAHIGTGCVAAIGGSCVIGTPATCCGNLFGLVGIDCTPVAASTSTSHTASSSSSHPASSAASLSHASSASSASSSSVRSSSSLAVSRSSSSASSASVSRSSSASSVRSSSSASSGSASASASRSSSSASSASVSHSSSVRIAQLFVGICFAFKRRPQQLRILRVGLAFVFGQQLRVSVCFAFERRPQQLRILRVGLSSVFGPQLFVGFACQQLRVGVSIYFAFKRRPQQLRIVRVGLSFILIDPLKQRSHSASPSSTPVTCDTKKTFCCSDLASTSSSATTTILSGLGIPVSSCGAHIGTGCIAAIGESCSIGTPAKCCGNLFGLVGIDCTAVTVSTSDSHSGSSSSSHPASSAASSHLGIVGVCLSLIAIGPLKQRTQQLVGGFAVKQRS